MHSAGFPSLNTLAVSGNQIERRDLLPLLLGARDRPTLTLVDAGLSLARMSNAAGVRVRIVTATQLRGDLFASLTPASASRVTALMLMRAEVTAKGLNAAARAFDPAALREVEFNDIALKNEGAASFAEAFKNYKLETLRFPSCRIQSGGVAALAGSSVLDSVKVLDLSGNVIGKAGAAALTKSAHLGNLQRLELTDWRVGADERKLLKAKFGKKLVI